MEQTYCPVCKFKKTSLKRYPSSICNECIVKYGTKTKDGKKINFSNESIFGGFISQIEGEKPYTQTTPQPIEKYHICYVNNQKCYANEARFGGIVIQLYSDYKTQFIQN